MGFPKASRTTDERPKRRMRTLAVSGGLLALLGVLLTPYARKDSRGVTGPTARVMRASRHSSNQMGWSPVTTRQAPNVREDEPAPNCPAAASAVGRLEERFRAELDSDPVYARYRDCLTENPDGRGCQSRLSDALYSSATRSLDPFVADEADRLKAQFGANSQAVRGYLRARVTSTRDPVTTMSTVNLLLLSCPDNGFPLPEIAYQDLSKRTAPELQMILNGHGTEPFPSQTVRDEIVDMAMDPNADSRARLFAMRTLGKTEEDVPILGGIVDWVLTGDPGASFLAGGPLAGSLARCGPACDGILQQLTSDPSPLAKHIARDTLAVFDSSERERVLSRLRAPAESEPTVDSLGVN